MTDKLQMEREFDFIAPVAPAERNAAVAEHNRTAVLDEAHLGDITGAFGTIARDAHPPTSRWKRLLALLAIMGPGLIVMIGDNDAGGVATYTQAGQNYGTSLLWTLLLLVPVLIVNQEMVVRLGAVTGVGHARLIFERFGKFWGAFSVVDLFILNFLTIVTEFIGISLGFGYFGVSPSLSVPIAAALLILMTVTGSFRRWERFMLLFVLVSFATIALGFLVHPVGKEVLHGLFVPGAQGGLDSTALLLIIAIVGTTVAPWQLFFQQSNVVDKRITPRWIAFERTDTVLGSVLTNVGAAALMIVCAYGFRNTDLFGKFSDTGVVAAGLRDHVSVSAGNILAVVLINASIIGAAAVTLATSYAFGDVFGVKHSLHRGVKDAKLFYAIFSGLVIVAAAIVLIPNAPLQLMTLAVQALAGLLLPSATVFLLLLCNDHEVLGPWANKPWLNAAAAVIVGTLINLSIMLVVATLFPAVDANFVTGILFALLAVALVVIGIVSAVRRGPALATSATVGMTGVDRANWRMPPLAELSKPVWSTTRKVGMLTLRIYLVVATALLVFKIVQLAIGVGAGG